MLPKVSLYDKLIKMASHLTEPYPVYSFIRASDLTEVGAFRKPTEQRSNAATAARSQQARLLFVVNWPATA